MKFRLALCLVLSGLFMTGCDFIQDIMDSAGGNQIKPEVQTVEFSCHQGEKTIIVESKCSWDVEYDSYWCTVGGSYGSKGTSELTITVFENTSAEPRNATLLLKNDEKDASVEIYVTQEGAAPTMGETINELTVGSDGGEFLVDLKTNMRFRAKSDQEWVYAEQDMYDEGLRIYVHEIFEDFTEDQRTATISLYAEVYSGNLEDAELLRTITVTQKNMSFRIEYTSATNYVPFSIDHFDADVIAEYCQDGKGYVDFDGPITISDGQFYYDTDLVSIKIPNCVTTIGEEAFCDCESLESVILPETIVSIGDGAFAGCGALTEIEFPQSLKEIGNNAFSQCKSLKKANFEEGLVSIGDRAFRSCTGIKWVYVPESVTYVGECPFLGCENLEEIEGGHATEDGRCLVIDGEIKAFAPCAETKYYDIPEGIKSVGSWVFSGLDNLSQVTMGDDVEEIKDHAFYYSSLDNTWSPLVLNNVVTIGDYAFAGTRLVKLTIPDSVTHIGKYAFNGCYIMTEVKFGKGLTAIEEGSFMCSGIKSFAIPKNITSIGDKAFKDCMSFLKTVKIHSGVTYLGTEAFNSVHLEAVYVRGKEPASAKLGENVFHENTVVYVPVDYEHFYRQALSPWLQYDPHDWVPDDVENQEPW